MSKTQEADDELLRMVLARYGDRLTGQETDEVRKIVRRIASTSEELRTVPLSNSDEPMALFQPYTEPCETSSPSKGED